MARIKTDDDRKIKKNNKGIKVSDIDTKTDVSKIKTNIPRPTAGNLRAQSSNKISLTNKNLSPFTNTASKGKELYRLGQKSASIASYAPKQKGIQQQQRDYLSKTSAQLGADRAAATSQVMTREFKRGRARDYSQDISIDVDRLNLSKTNKRLLRAAVEVGNIKRDFTRQGLDIDRQGIAVEAAGAPGIVQSELRTRTMGDLLTRGARDYESELRYGILPAGDVAENLKELGDEIAGSNIDNLGVIDNEFISHTKTGTRQVRPSIVKAGKKAKQIGKAALKRTPFGQIYGGTKKIRDYVYPLTGE